MILDADTIIEPRTVVIETFNAAIADSAVFGAGCPQHSAVRTHLRWVYFR